MNDEIRDYSEPLEVRTREDGTEVIEGYAVTFDTRSEDLGGFTETISAGALSGTKIDGAVVTFNHNPDNIVARHPQTMTYTVDRRGLKISFEPAKTSAGNDLKELVRRGDVHGMSFTFRLNKGGDKWEKPKEAGGLYHRTLTSIDVIPELGPVVFPAYRSTNVEFAKRAMGIFKDMEERRESERLQQERELEEARIDNYHRKLKLKMRQKFNK